jgi:hypothetical protein
MSLFLARLGPISLCSHFCGIGWSTDMPRGPQLTPSSLPLSQPLIRERARRQVWSGASAESSSTLTRPGGISLPFAAGAKGTVLRLLAIGGAPSRETRAPSHAQASHNKREASVWSLNLLRKGRSPQRHGDNNPAAEGALQAAGFLSMSLSWPAKPLPLFPSNRSELNSAMSPTLFTAHRCSRSAGNWGEAPTTGSEGRS